MREIETYCDIEGCEFRVDIESENPAAIIAKVVKEHIRNEHPEMDEINMKFE